MVQQNEDFDWDKFDAKGIGLAYSQDERKHLEALYTDTMLLIKEKEVVRGRVVNIAEREVILDIGLKSDGLVPVAEFRDMPDLKIGDEVDVFIESQENLSGQLVLSRKKAKMLIAWKNIQSALDDDIIVEGIVKRRTKGGLIVDIFGIEAFLPGSQIDVKPIRDFDQYVNKKMEVKVIKINNANDNVVVSHKILIEKDLEEQRQVILTNLERGQILEGVIKNMTNFGVFIDLGGVDGLLHITDISWGRVTDPKDVLELDQKVNVVVLDFDEDKKRISLGMKQLTSHPWESLNVDIEIGSKVKGKVVNIADYGVFLEVIPGVEGLIHVSEMSWSQHIRNPHEFLKIGDEVEAVVLTIDREERKMSLGVKQMVEDPWTRQDLFEKYAVGTKHKGTVRNLTTYGLFIELEEGIDGLVHVSDLSWSRRIKHPSEFIKVNEDLDVIVLEIDVENRRLSLGHKQLEQNPWDTFETIFTVGSVHRCTVLEKSDRGAVLELPYGVEGYAPVKGINKTDGSTVEVGDALDFMVIEFSKEEKKIVLSHTKTFEKKESTTEASTEVVVEPKKKTTVRKKKDIVENKEEGTDNKEDNSTLGDNEALSAIKQKMEDEKA